MPKVIENVKEKLIEQAKKQVLENGYSATSIRSVAKACGIAIGTVYNYFPSKDMMIASFMSVDWHNAVSAMKAKSQNQEDPIKVLKIIHKELCSFIKIYEGIFNDPDSKASFNSFGPGKHSVLVNQLSEIVKPSCENKAKDKNLDISEFVIETLLMWTMQQKSFADYIKIISLLFIQEENK